MDNFKSTLFTDKDLSLQVSSQRNTGCWTVSNPPSKYKVDVLYFVGKYDDAVKKFGRTVTPIDFSEKKYNSQVVKSFDNDALRSLLVESKKIGNADIPRNIKMSDNFKLLFSMETGYWMDCFYDVRRIVENEILHRVAKNKF